MPSLSLIMIVKNESKWLADCLASVRNIVDEMVIADTGSTDDTIEIARSFDAQVFSIPWNDDFAEARNRGMSQAEGDWLLHMDADEVLDPDGARRIRRLVDADGNGADAIEVTLANYCNALRSWRWIPVQPDDPMARGEAGFLEAKLLRLFRNRRGFEYRESVHENITESVRERGGVRRAEPIVIHHYGMAGKKSSEPGPKDYLYLSIEQKKVKERPNDPKSWYDLGEQLLVVGRHEEGERAHRKALELDPDTIDSRTALAGALLARGAVEKARELLEEAVRKGISPPHFVLMLGGIALHRGDLDEAHHLLEAVLQDNPKNILARLCMARVYDRMGDPARGRNELEQAHATAPALEEPRSRLDALILRLKGEELFVGGDARGALEALVKALRLDPEDPLIHNDVGVVSNALGASEKACESFERALKLAPGLPEAKENLAMLKRGAD